MSKLIYGHSVECFDCGTGYSVKGPLGAYYANDDRSTDPVILCDECFDERECPIDINADNYFEVAEALHAVLTVWHDGGKGYELLCRSEFKPGHSWSESQVEEENEYFAEIEELYEKGTNFEAMEKILDRIDEVLEETKDS